MRINGKPYHTIWLSNENPSVVQIIDQRRLPFVFEIFDLKTPDDCFFAIRDMAVRGAPLIGVTAAYGMHLALLCYKGDNPGKYLTETANKLKLTRPTAVNLAYAVDVMLKFMLQNLHSSSLKEISLAKVEEMKSREIGFSEKIGEFGLKIIEERDAEEVTHIEGWKGSSIQQVRLIPEASKAANYGFDVTPARLITGLITERGICKASKKSILNLFPGNK